jgi:hypothetical protein
VESKTVLGIRVMESAVGAAESRSASFVSAFIVAEEWLDCGRALRVGKVGGYMMSDTFSGCGSSFVDLPHLVLITCA